MWALGGIPLHLATQVRGKSMPYAEGTSSYRMAPRIPNRHSGFGTTQIAGSNYSHSPLIRSFR